MVFTTIKGRLDDVRTLKQLFVRAEEVAARDGRDVPGPEHVIVAACDLPDGTAEQALTAVGIDPAGLEGAIRRAHAAALGLDGDDGPVTTPPPPRSTPYRMTGAGERFLRSVHDVHVAIGGRLRGAHVLLAAADLDAGVWPRVVDAAGTTPDRLRAASLTALGA